MRRFAQNIQTGSDAKIAKMSMEFLKRAHFAEPVTVPASQGAGQWKFSIHTDSPDRLHLCAREGRLKTVAHFVS
jgi:hypothetical protein